MVFDAAVRGFKEQISPSTIGRILNIAPLKPHRSQYWLNHEVIDNAVFRSVVRDVCKLYHQAQELHEQGVHIGRRDEKTGIQALDRAHPTLASGTGETGSSYARIRTTRYPSFDRQF